jgi:hypothetical protein
VSKEDTPSHRGKIGTPRSAEHTRGEYAKPTRPVGDDHRMANEAAYVNQVSGFLLCFKK